MVGSIKHPGLPTTGTGLPWQDRRPLWAVAFSSIPGAGRGVTSRASPSSDILGLTWDCEFPKRQVGQEKSDGPDSRLRSPALCVQLHVHGHSVFHLFVLSLSHRSRPFLLHPRPAPALSSVPPPFPVHSRQGCAQCSGRARLADQALPRREGSLKVGDRLLSIDGIPLHGASHTAALATLRQCSHEALFQVEYDVAIPGELGA